MIWPPRARPAAAVTLLVVDGRLEDVDAHVCAPGTINIQQLHRQPDPTCGGMVFQEPYEVRIKSVVRLQGQETRGRLLLPNANGCLLAPRLST